MDEAVPGDAHPAEALLADARAQAAAAQADGQPYLVAVGRTRAGQALLMLGRPDEALAEFDQAQAYVDMLRADGAHDRDRLLHASSLSLPPPDRRHGDLGLLEAWVRVGRAAAYASLGRWADARAAVDQARPFVKGWGRRAPRKALDSVASEIARADGSPREATSALDKVIADPGTDDAERRRARYERAIHLVDAGQPEEAMRESLTLIRDCDDDPALAARTRQVLGTALLALGREDDATLTLLTAFDDFERLGDSPAVVAAAPGLAWRLSETGDPRTAAAIAERALAHARSLPDPSAETDLRIARATALDAAGETDEAIAEFARAAVAAERAGDAVRLQDARHGEAIVRTRSADAAESVEALSLLDAAAAGYADAGLPERAAECQHEAAALLGRLGSLDAAHTRYAAARDAYLAIPDVLRAADPGAVPDCDFNLAVLAALRATPSPPPPDAFRSGGHHMRHDRSAT